MTQNMSTQPSPDLLPRIMKRIQKEQRILVYKKLGIFSFTLILSAISLIPSFKLLAQDVSNSGFLSFASLLFSDFSSVLSYWKSFGMILLETLPAISFAIVLAIMLTFFESAILIIKNIKTYKTINHYEFR